MGAPPVDLPETHEYAMQIPQGIRHEVEALKKAFLDKISGELQHTSSSVPADVSLAGQQHPGSANLPGTEAVIEQHLTSLTVDVDEEALLADDECNQPKI